jgi:hypothetical protein
LAGSIRVNISGLPHLEQGRRRLLANLLGESFSLISIFASQSVLGHKGPPEQSSGPRASI